MSGPPQHIPPNALFDALCALPRPCRVVDLPRKDPTGETPFQVHMQVLTQQERMAATAEAERFAQRALRAREKNEESFAPKRGEHSQGYEDLYYNELSTQLLVRACRRVEDPKWPFFPSADHIRKTLTGDEIGVLSSTYHVVQAELGPILVTLDNDEVDAWIAVLKEGASARPLSHLSSGALRDLVMALVSRLSPSSTGTGSSGEPAEDGVTNSSGQSDDEFAHVAVSDEEL